MWHVNFYGKKTRIDAPGAGHHIIVRTLRQIKEHEGDFMDVYTAIKERKSCRNFLPDVIDNEMIDKIIEAGVQAPSPLNIQPWNFIVITNNEVKEKIHAEAQRCKKWAVKASGWKWLETYSVDFLKSTPVIIAVTGDTRKSGVDEFQEGGPLAYQHACAAAIQNMLLVVHALGLGSLWFTLFDKNHIKDLLKIDENKTPLALICIGKAAKEVPKTARKEIAKKTTYIR